MDFAISQELRMMRETVRGFVGTHLAPLERSVDEEDHLAPETMARLRAEAVKLGLYGYNMPKELGGPGLSAFAKALVAEELGHTTMALAEMLGHLPSTLLFCNAEQTRWLMPALMDGSKTITYALTEPDAGSDLNALRTRARKVDGGWLLQGRKQFVSNVETADHVIVLAVTRPQGRLKDKLTTFLVERRNPGLQDLTRFKKLGWRGYQLNGFALEDCFVPDGHVLGEVGGGFLAMMTSINHDRLNIACRCVGLAERAHALSRAYAKERSTFGAKLAEHQAIQFMIADTDTEIHAARALAHRAAHLADAEDPEFRIAASRAKLFASEMVGRAVDRALQIFGGAGYMCDLPLERFYRDARAYRLGEGTSEIQRIQIARHALSEQS